MAATTVLVDADKLETFCAGVLHGAGMPEKDAAFSARCLVQTTLWGIDSHGVMRLIMYTERLRNGAVNPRPDIRTVREFGGVARLDGDDGLGYVVGRAAMEKALALAERHGIGSVTVKRSNHFGAAALYVREAAKAGMIGMAISNTPVNMAVPGSRGPVLGNHPWAFAIPTFDGAPFVLDLCLSQVAGGKLLVARDKGEKIPFGWAVDKDGNPTDDPAAGIAGAFLPMSGHKGYGLALVVELLTGALSGGAFMGDIGHLYKEPEKPSGVCHHMLAINPLAAMDKEEWQAAATEIRRRIKAAPMAEPGAQLVFPGELEDACDAGRRAGGVSMETSLLEKFNALGKDFGLQLAPR